MSDGPTRGEFEQLIKLLAYPFQLEVERRREEVLALPRYAADRLLNYGYRIYSQCDEDGILAEIFKRIGEDSKRFVEIGIGDGTQCNTTKLLVADGWSGRWIEALLPNYNAAAEHFKPFADRLEVVGGVVTAENINQLVGTDAIDLLSIDVDGNDYWLWRALRAIPRVVCIEYNAMFPPPISVVQPYEPLHRWDGTNYMGASLEALERLGRAKGYSLVGCSFSGANAFFVRNDLALVDVDGDKRVGRFHGPATAVEHYEPVRYYAAVAIGHKPNPAPYLRVGVDGEIDGSRP